ncbi:MULTISPECIES: hypothetical protein [unclassified Anaeromyxobacter]|uniref:hypothetical protein n=1 Tax=unclassified Anaeromyxobacter TaxID=2620896 RepID=UPI001F5783DE|nr:MULTISPECIES: hypothetical protein [unclassified Anaeromyxobacter]
MKEKGWSAVPRTLSVVLCALQDRDVRGAVDLSRVYVDLWTRTFDEGLIEIPDEAEAAWLSGFAKNRTRSWRERVRHLERLGFIKVFSDAVHDIAAIGLIHPHIAMMRLRRQGRVNDGIWALYTKKLDAAAGSAPVPPEDEAQDTTHADQRPSAESHGSGIRPPGRVVEV